MGIAVDMITARPDLQGIYGIIDDSAMGALQGLRSAGRLDDVLIAGHNGTCEALASLLKGDSTSPSSCSHRRSGRRWSTPPS